MEPLTVPGTLDSLSTIAKYVLSAAAAAGLDKKASYNLRLAVDEIATNIIMYGYEEAGLEGVVDLAFEIDEQTLKVWVEDTSQAFDPFQKLAVEEARVHQLLEERPMGGLGVYLAVQGVDKFVYERVDGKNRHVFIVNRLPVETRG